MKHPVFRQDDEHDEISIKILFHGSLGAKNIKKYHKYCLENIEKDDIKNDKYLIDWLNLKENNCDCESNLYESKVSPVLKFIHELDFKSCGWIQINKYSKIKDKEFTCENEYNISDYKHIKPINDKDDISHFRILSFDIECDSLNGDFPSVPPQNPFN